MKVNKRGIVAAGVNVVAGLLCLPAFLAFGLTIFGTFLTRSGILSSIHAFGDGPVGMYFLGFLALVVLAGVALDRVLAQLPPLRGKIAVSRPRP